MKTQIIVENVRVHQAERAVYNQPDLFEVEFVYNGEVVDIDPKVIEEFKFTGLSNIDFVEDYEWDKDERCPLDDGPFNGIAPNNLDEAVEQIMVQLTTANCSDISMVKGDSACICLNGMSIRNDWNLWYKSNLSLWFADHGIYHADDMSAVIATRVWEIVNQVEHQSLEDHKKYFDAHWAEYNCDVKAEFEERCKKS